MLDVSRTGARLEGARLPKAGKDIILRCGGIDTFGTIAWAESGRCGIRFDEPIDIKDLVTLRALSQAAQRSRFDPDAVQAAADWASGLAR